MYSIFWNLAISHLQMAQLSLHWNALKCIELFVPFIVCLECSLHKMYECILGNVGGFGSVGSAWSFLNV